MKRFDIQIRSVKEVLDDFRQAFKAARQGKEVPKIEGVFFTSLEAARNLLTPERVRLLRLIRQHRPTSVYELAGLAGRDLKNVYDDVATLERHGILKTTLERQQKRARRIPEVPYDEIRVHIPLSGVRESGKNYDTDRRDREASRPSTYEASRLRYRPNQIRWLLVAESPPSDPNRYFYFKDVSRADFLFLETMRVIYPDRFTSAKEVRQKKPTFLERFSRDGFYLIDAVEHPLGSLSQTVKVGKIREELPELLATLKNLVGKGTKIILISVPVHKACFAVLKETEFDVVNDEPIDFPALGRQADFRLKMRKALARAGWQSV